MGTKQGKPYRVVPLFPELRWILTELFELAPDGSEYVITRYRSAAQNLRTQFGRILKRAGVEPWPRLFQNLRASRETELANKYPLHVVTAWLGNTPTVAEKHYLQTTEEHFRQAAAHEGGGAIGGAIGCDGGANSVPHSLAPRRQNTEKAAPCDSMQHGAAYEAPPVGLEPTRRVGETLEPCW